MGDVVTEGLGEELIRGGEVLFAVPEQHTRPAVERGPRQPRPRGWSCPDRPHPTRAATSRPSPVGDALDRVGHRRDLGLAADDARRRDARQAGPAAASTSVVGPAERLPAHLDGLDRVGQALQRQCPERSALVTAAPTGHQPHHVGGQDLPALARARRAGPPRSPGPRSSRRPLCVTSPPLSPTRRPTDVLAAAVVAFDALLHGHRARQARPTLKRTPP